ncbi:bifunctional diaminohydroxyphosphoribosylaminopyrimidine deaminase/5-amino-6-(5-phosphoribosylamino)uracil reductase RibD [Bacillus sp. FJAT-29790]|uniref:bifunctional diaminohydroxyphosphoribosylaminopyrimidine deaminase/5-amino-6-(5-phosphoribosylamino)uracil reductase RibD n=1 Tax=Bacillus sp. FJAT-29790 TaxID=1895002 RepID=UPI001C237D88|nr:bifunctional diaminohydroxyphosphoribosylaminopyrimidine deaminase/5-amino-6-(5-phosphoribosylamino)uracil reductase RibD [Bacillus sp. FJAT-29790]MBU8878760.1 bifunctional diaminohydroxyphosphoribosylaminopyrimidine deaminase/5-amino-6-(5-phosphoribosylamino)uracil reductase RibD [Bacillus sp. FJAT-29790]
MQDYDYMKLALTMAQATSGQASPNPKVGAVVVKNGEVLGMGAHLKAGTPHAEVHAINAAGEQAKGADIYVTLEPCSHYGKTPPCADLIIRSGIKRVVVAALDPNPLVAGNGIAKLKKAGIEVEIGVGEADANAMNESFYHFIQTKTPYVTIKAAASLDGKTAAKTGDSKWITSPESRLDVHQLRHEHDAILTGVNTIIHDNPHLTTRLPRGGKNPIRIVLDTHLRIPLESNVIQDRAVQTIIFTGSEVDTRKSESIQQFGVEVFSFPQQSVLIPDVLKELGKRNMISVLVEGGSEIHSSFIENEAFQQIVLYIAPKIIGGKNAIPLIGGQGIELVGNAKKLKFESVEPIGCDLKIIAKPRKEDKFVCSPE